MDSANIKELLGAWELDKNEGAKVLFTGIDLEEFPTLYPENIMQTPDEIAELVIATKQRYEHLETFSAKQEVFYEAVTSAMVFSKWNQLKDIKSPVLELYQTALNSDKFQALEQDLTNHLEETHKMAERFVKDHIFPPEHADAIQRHHDFITESLRKLDPDAVPERFTTAMQEHSNDIIVNYITVKIHNEYQQKAVADYIKPFLEESFTKGDLERAPLYASDAPEVAHFILTGPPAVGKSSSLPYMKDLCEEKGCKWDDVLKMSGDERRDFLASIYDDEYCAIMDPEQVMSDGRIIKRKISQTLDQLLEEGKSRPIYHDEATAIKAMSFVNLAIRGNTPLYVVQKDLDPEVSIARSFKRYQETKRPNATREIYVKHRDFPGIIEKFLKRCEGHKVYYNLLNAEAPIGEPSPKIMQVDTEAGKCKIYDVSRAFAFQHKGNISNIDAKPSKDCQSWEELKDDITRKLYPANKTNPLSSMEWLNNYCKRYQVDFMDVDTDQPIFSILDRGTRVVIKDKDLFQKKMKEDAAFKQVVDTKFPSLVRVSSSSSIRARS